MGEARRRQELDPDRYGAEGLTNDRRNPSRAVVLRNGPPKDVGVKGARHRGGIKVRVPVGEGVESSIQLREELKKAGMG